MKPSAVKKGAQRTDSERRRESTGRTEERQCGRIGCGSGSASDAVRVECQWAARCATSWTRGGTGGGSGGASDAVRVSDDRRFRDSR
jgi:hypothetical protein